MRPTTALALAGLTTALLTGCTADDPAPAPTSTAAGTDDTVPFQQVGASEAQELGVPYIGLSEAEAFTKAQVDGVTARVGTAADVGDPGMTDDYVIGRITLVVDGGVVTEVIVEGDEGPITVAAS